MGIGSRSGRALRRRGGGELALLRCRARLLGRGRRLFAGAFLLADPLLLRELDRLADALAEVEELRPAGLAAALHRHLADERRVQREDALDALVVHDAPDGERLVDPPALLHDDRAGENLD